MYKEPYDMAPPWFAYCHGHCQVIGVCNKINEYHSIDFLIEKDTNKSNLD